jgi:hypothetical protein
MELEHNLIQSLFYYKKSFSSQSLPSTILSYLRISIELSEISLPFLSPYHPHLFSVFLPSLTRSLSIHLAESSPDIKEIDRLAGVLATAVGMVEEVGDREVLEEVDRVLGDVKRVVIRQGRWFVGIRCEG